jgi:hypothetical protein
MIGLPSIVDHAKDYNEQAEGRAYRAARSNTMVASVVLHRRRLRPDQNMASNRNHRR